MTTNKLEKIRRQIEENNRLIEIRMKELKAAKEKMKDLLKQVGELQQNASE